MRTSEELFALTHVYYALTQDVLVVALNGFFYPMDKSYHSTATRCPKMQLDTLH